jgi:tRNA nucleotidyltransferase (CCA-adding enzyme)
LATLTIESQTRECEALRLAVPTEVWELARTLKARGHRSWAVGGSVRDVVLAAMQGGEFAFNGDWDVATDARPEQVKAAFRKVIPTGIAHGTVTVLIGQAALEVTTLRGESGHTDGRHPDEVFFVDDLKEDLARRDFTINAIAFDLDTHDIIDPFSGRSDLARRLIRAVGDPKERYTEDGLRPLRAARFAAQLEMELEPETREAIRPTLDRFRLVSKERVLAEWLKALKTAHPSRCFRILLSEGLLHASLPELFPLATAEDLDQALTLLDAAAPDPVRRLAHLFSYGLSQTHPNRRDRAEKAAHLALVLRMAKKDQVRIGRLIRAEELPRAEPGDVRHFLSRVTREHAPDGLVYLRERGASKEILDLCDDELRSGAPLSLKELAVTGSDLLKSGLPPGPQIRTTLENLLADVLEDPSQNEHELLMTKARLAAPAAKTS